MLSLPLLACRPLTDLMAAAASNRPNILFIMTDDHAAHAISCYGSKVNQTPQPRPDRQRRHADGPRLRHQLDLHAQPRDAS